MSVSVKRVSMAQGLHCDLRVTKLAQTSIGKRLTRVH